MNETLKQDYQNRFNELTKKIQTLRELTWDLWYSIDSYEHDYLADILEKADDVLDGVDEMKFQINELNLIMDMLKAEQNELKR